MTTPFRLDGITPILHMPFLEDDAIDHESLSKLAHFLVGTGVQGVGIGYGSEIYRMTDEERDDALRTAADAVAGRVPIVVATGANSTRATILRSLRARELGGGVLMIVPPGLPPAGPDDVVRHYRAVWDAVGLPIIVQDAPQMSGVVMSDALLQRLADEVEGVVSIKIEVSPPAPRVYSARRAIKPSVTVLGGAGGLDFFHELERGADGTIPGAAFPELFNYVYREFKAGRTEQARAAFNRFVPFYSMASRTPDTFHALQKEILRRRGIFRTNLMRTPSERLDDRLFTELDDFLAELGLSDLAAGWPADYFEKLG